MMYVCVTKDATGVREGLRCERVAVFLGVYDVGGCTMLEVYDVQCTMLLRLY